MAKRLAGLAAAVGVLALVVSMVVPAVAHNDGDGGKRVTLRLAEKAADDAQFDTQIDVGEKGFSVGDYTVIGGEPVYNRALTKKLGTISGDVLIVSITEQSATVEIDATFNLKGGLITVEGPFTFSEQSSDSVQELAVTGGTDAYKTAHGELEVDTSEPNFRFTFKLIL